MDWNTPIENAWPVLAVTGVYYAEWSPTGVSLGIIDRPDIDRDFRAGETIRTDQTVLEMLTSDCLGINSVQRGERIVYQGREYHIDRVESDDGLITRVICSDRSG